MTIHELKKNGFRVRVNQLRWGKAKEGWLILAPKWVLKKNKLPISNFGGVTEISVTKPDKTTIHAEAECSIKDNFIYKEGLRLALERVLAKLN